MKALKHLNTRPMSEPSTITPVNATSEPVVVKRQRQPAATGKIRAELNMEKWPGVWQPSKSKNEKTLRVLQREINNPDGSSVVSRVEVGYTHLGTLTTEERKMYGALIEVWEQSGKPSDRPVFFSDRLLARILRKGWGTNVRDAIVKSLRKLRTVPIEWINSYYQKTEEGKTVLRERTPFTILSELKIVEREVDGVVNRAVGYFKPDDRILQNLLANYTKPLLLDVMLRLKTDIAVLLYTHVDLMLARKDIYERRSKQLFEDLGLTNHEYNRPYERYRALKKAVEELQGVRLSTGVLKNAGIVKTLDGKDYKTVFKKVAAKVEELPENEEPPAVVIHHYTKTKDPLIEQANVIIREFHRLVHGVTSHEPQSKEVGQAMTLLGQYGFEKSQHIIQYAYTSAKDTNFNMQHFGAVLSYGSRGAEDFDRSRRPVDLPRGKVAIAPVARAPEEQPTRGAMRLALLTPEQYQRRFEQAKSELFQQVPFLAERRRSGGQLADSMVRAHLVRQLEQETMDLLPFASLKLPEPLAQIFAASASENRGTSL
jgi:hypothetical protein